MNADTLTSAPREALKPVKAWQCIGCGMIEAPQTCIGVCQHVRVEFVYRAEHEQALAAADARIAALADVVRRIAHITPRDGEWERSYRALQAEARRLLSVDPLVHDAGVRR